MRLSYVLVVIAATFLLASEAFSTTADSVQGKISDVASPDSPTQRLLRTHHAAYEDGEERALTLKKMKRMRKEGKTKEDYAAKLKITDEVNRIAAGGVGMVQFMNSHKYDKYKTYINFLIDMKRKGK
ncbi:hypothetical protein PHYBOEH_000016 [Phytophthora boehmeriae]|uniref:PexRD2 WYL domain-containing protein n=1 Tax=Phytophthora boehmeriae TaxID=109152 RepID=A0A8T1XDF3_9STRA|nr:hypothetical protein PHYBOEH_000016 [Phytophthora boehmeriae]